MRRFTPEEIQEKKNLLAEKSIVINDISTEAKETSKGFKEQLKPLIEEKSAVLKDLKTKSEFVNEECFKFIDHTEGMVGFYNGEGVLVESRQIRPEESQLTIFRELKNGTSN